MLSLSPWRAAEFHCLNQDRRSKLNVATLGDDARLGVFGIRANRLVPWKTTSALLYGRFEWNKYVREDCEYYGYYAVS